MSPSPVQPTQCPEIGGPARPDTHCEDQRPCPITGFQNVSPSQHGISPSQARMAPDLRMPSPSVLNHGARQACGAREPH